MYRLPEGPSQNKNAGQQTNGLPFLRGSRMTNFPGKEKILFWQERKRLKQEIRRAILAAMTLARNPKDRVTIERFIDVIEPGELYDIARLPDVGKINGNAFSASKVRCIFALIAYVILDYWMFIETENPDCIATCEERIERLKLACNGYDTLIVHGDLIRGYWLE